ncbi:ABC transporter substrate-binding protein [Diaminobutyricibacter sp. McL0618]|uniref:ABC transporter substrate-binding protein n=1 Tax=Leifsonia sp. McL0618 TaxID=3415677 RepID=UPI003CEFB469
MRKPITVLAAAAATVALAGGLSGCSTTAAEPANKVSLSFLTFETPSLTAKFWDTSIADAAKQVPGVTVKKIVSPDADRTAYAKQLQATGQLPDVQSSITVGDFTAAGLLKPFPQSWLNENFVLPNAQAIKGKTYVPPTNAQLLPLVYYNKAIFAKNNIALPTNYAEFLTAVKALKAAGVTPIELDGADPWAASMPLVALASADVLGSNPSWIQDRYKGTVKFTDPLFTGAMQKELDLIKMGAYSPTALSVDFATANKDFLAGKAGMYIMGSWFTGTGYMTVAQSDAFGAFPLPTDSGELVVPVNVGGTTSVAAKSPHAAQALAFAEAWSLSPSSMKALIESDGAMPMMKKTPLKDYHATVSTLFTDTYKLITDKNKKVSAFGWVNNDDTLAPGMNDEFYALSQALFSNKDLHSQLAKLDADWDKATK